MTNKMENTVKNAQDNFENGNGVTGKAHKLIASGVYGSVHTQTIVTIDKLNYSVDTNFLKAVLSAYPDSETRKAKILEYKFIHVVDEFMDFDNVVSDEQENKIIVETLEEKVSRLYPHLSLGCSYFKLYDGNTGEYCFVHVTNIRHNTQNILVANTTTILLKDGFDKNFKMNHANDFPVGSLKISEHKKISQVEFNKVYFNAQEIYKNLKQD